MGHLRRATRTLHLISAQTSQEGIEFTKAKLQIWSYSGWNKGQSSTAVAEDLRTTATATVAEV